MILQLEQLEKKNSFSDVTYLWCFVKVRAQVFGVALLKALLGTGVQPARVLDFFGEPKVWHFDHLIIFDRQQEILRL